MQSPNLGLRNAASDSHESEAQTAQTRNAQTRRHTLAALNDSRALTLLWRPVKGPSAITVAPRRLSRLNAFSYDSRS